LCGFNVEHIVSDSADKSARKSICAVSWLICAASIVPTPFLVKLVGHSMPMPDHLLIHKMSRRSDAPPSSANAPWDQGEDEPWLPEKIAEDEDQRSEEQIWQDEQDHEDLVEEYWDHDEDHEEKGENHEEPEEVEFWDQFRQDDQDHEEKGEDLAAAKESEQEWKDAFDSERTVESDESMKQFDYDRPSLSARPIETKPRSSSSATTVPKTTGPWTPSGVKRQRRSLPPPPPPPPKASLSSPPPKAMPTDNLTDKESKRHSLPPPPPPPGPMMRAYYPHEVSSCIPSDAPQDVVYRILRNVIRARGGHIRDYSWEDDKIVLPIAMAESSSNEHTHNVYGVANTFAT
jgi:hypothetical protein